MFGWLRKRQVGVWVVPLLGGGRVVFEVGEGDEVPIMRQCTDQKSLHKTLRAAGIQHSPQLKRWIAQHGRKVRHNMFFSQRETNSQPTQTRLTEALLLTGFFGVIAFGLAFNSTGNWWWTLGVLGAGAVFSYAARRYCT